MNPEKLYPELVTLKPREIFVEWVMVTKNLVVLEKIHYKKLSLRRSRVNSEEN